MMKRSRSGKSRVKVPGPKKKGSQPKKQSRPTGPQNLVISHKDLFPKGSFAKAGGMLGSIFGPKGAMLGAGAGSMLSRITGVGDYKVKSNSIMTDTASFSGEVPAFGKTDNSTRVRHREFVMDVTMNATPAAFRNTSYVIQPSNATLFPWLSSLAQNYQQYRMHGCVFVFKSTTSDYSAAGALGKVAMATNYNVRDSDFVSMQELENAEFSVSGKPSLSRVHPIECASNNGVPLVKWVRDAQYDASGGDDRLYDVGKFQFATSGLPAGTANSVIGELWISYDIEFFKPIINRQPTAAAYVPVTVPVFDTLGGDSTTNLFQLEKTVVSIPDGSSAATIWEKLHRPDTYSRIPPISIDNAKLTFSPNRPTPDTPSTLFTYPAYWAQGIFESDSGGPGGVVTTAVPTKTELRITRPGVWYLNFKVDMSQSTGLDSAYTHLTQGPPTSSTSTLWTQPAIVVRVCDSSGNTNTDYTNNFYSTNVLSRNVNVGFVANSLGDQSQLIAARPPAVPTQQSAGHYFYPNGAGYTAIIWVDSETVENGRAVCLRFQTPWEATTSALRAGSTEFAWYDGTRYVGLNNINSMTFEIGFVNVQNKTYYEPAVPAGLTKDDTQNLESSIKMVSALIPKLKELGFDV